MNTLRNANFENMKILNCYMPLQLMASIAKHFLVQLYICLLSSSPEMPKSFSNISWKVQLEQQKSLSNRVTINFPSKFGNLSYFWSSWNIYQQLSNVVAIVAGGQKYNNSYSELKRENQEKSEIANAPDLGENWPIGKCTVVRRKWMCRSLIWVIYGIMSLQVQLIELWDVQRKLLLKKKIFLELCQR